jgi:hypothetical protein
MVKTAVLINEFGEIDFIISCIQSSETRQNAASAAHLEQLIDGRSDGKFPELIVSS